MRYTSLLTTLIIFLVFIIGCTKDKPVEFLLGLNKEMNPYTGYETLVFKNDQGDSLIFKGNGRHSHHYEYEPSGTPYGHWINETDICTFIETQNRYFFEINLGSHAGSGFSMRFIFYQTNEQLNDDCYWYTSNLHSYFNAYSEPQASYIDSMVVLNTTYYNIITDSTYWGSHLAPDGCEKYISTTHYSKESGFIKLDFQDGDSWGLVKVTKK